MYRYEELRVKHGNPVSQTIDSPIMVVDFWEISDVFVALFIILIFGVLFYSWGLMFFLLIFCLGVGPIIKKRNQRGVYVHFPYRKLMMSLPGLMNPGSDLTYSD